MGTIPDLAAVRAYLKVPAAVLPDADLELMLGAALGDQIARCQWGTDPAVPNPADDYPDPLAMALMRRVQREAAARNLPLGMVGLDAGEYGPTRLPAFDALIEEHERGYRRAVLA